MSETTGREQQSTPTSRPLDTTSHGTPTIIVDEYLEEVLVRIKSYLRETTKASSVQRGLGNRLDDGVYLISESEVHGLLNHLFDLAERTKKDDPEAVSPSRSPGLPSSSGPTSRVLRPLHSVPPTAADPATTIASSQVVMTRAAGDVDEEIARDTSTTAATIVSRDSVTEVTWLSSPGDLQRNDTTLEPPSSGQGRADLRATENHRSIGRDSRALGERHTEFVNDDDADRRWRDSMRVPESSDHAGRPMDRQAKEGTERRPSILGRVRKKSVQLVQAVGAYVNGAYLNADYRPRRPSAVVRTKAILDREPPRPPEDAAVFSALTGAQPLQHDDWMAARRPGPCSEDGRQHDCVQHETPPS